MALNETQNHTKSLENIDFLAWSVSRTKSARQERKIAKILSSRPRQRSTNHLN